MIEQARQFAEKAHEGQVRKFTGEPYIEHPIRVAQEYEHWMKAYYTYSNYECMIAAGFLHDVVEDCGISLETITQKFGYTTGYLVQYMTKGMPTWVPYSLLTPAAILKACDIYDNTRNIKDVAPPKFWKRYLPVKRKQLEELRRHIPEALYLQVKECLSI